MLFKVVMRMIMSNNLAGDEDDLVEDTRRSIPDWREVGREQQWATGGKWGFSISKY